MVIGAEPLVAAGRHAPTGLTNTEREIRFVPFRRPERLVERADALDACPPDHPGTDHRVHLLKAEPVARAWPDRALEPPPVGQVSPPGDRLVEWRAREAAAQ